MKRALPLALVALLAFFARDLYSPAHAVEPIPLGDSSAAQPVGTTIARNDGGTLPVIVSNVVALDSDTSAKLGAAVTKVNVFTTVTEVPATPLAGRRALELQNLGPNALWCCLGSGCTPVEHGSRKIVGSGGVASWDIGDAIPARCLVSTATQVDGGSTIATEIR